MIIPETLVRAGCASFTQHSCTNLYFRKGYYTMNCINCKAELPDNSKFCPMCGQKQPDNSFKFCTNCGTKLAGSAKFCFSCGTPTAPAAGAAPAKPAAPAFNPNPATPMFNPNAAVNPFGSGLDFDDNSEELPEDFMLRPAELPEGYAGIMERSVSDTNYSMGGVSKAELEREAAEAAAKAAAERAAREPRPSDMVFASVSPVVQEEPVQAATAPEPEMMSSVSLAEIRAEEARKAAEAEAKRAARARDPRPSDLFFGIQPPEDPQSNNGGSGFFS